jgi:tight adherence protein B
MGITTIAILGAGFVILLGYGIYLMAARRRAILARRVETYASIEEEAALVTEAELRRMSPVSRFFHLLLGRTYVQRLEENLARADIPMRASEYILLRLALAGAALVFGMYMLGHLQSGIILAVVGFFVPAAGVRVSENRRRAKFVRQLADALMLLTNSLRSGYSFLKGLELVAKEMDDPLSKELNRMLREVNLGATIDDAMMNLGRRVNSQDLDIVISAFLVQKEVGGNLTEIMEKVAETIRERLRIQGDIRVLTAQGRLSGLIVGALPFVVAAIIYLKTPDYFQALLGPPLASLFGLQVPFGVLILVGALILQAVGAWAIYRIIAIKV